MVASLRRLLSLWLLCSLSMAYAAVHRREDSYGHVSKLKRFLPTATFNLPTVGVGLPSSGGKNTEINVDGPTNLLTREDDDNSVSIYNNDGGDYTIVSTHSPGTLVKGSRSGNIFEERDDHDLTADTGVASVESKSNDVAITSQAIPDDIPDDNIARISSSGLLQGLVSGGSPSSLAHSRRYVPKVKFFNDKRHNYMADSLDTVLDGDDSSADDTLTRITSAAPAPAHAAPGVSSS